MGRLERERARFAAAPATRRGATTPQKALRRPPKAGDRGVLYPVTVARDSHQSDSRDSYKIGIIEPPRARREAGQARGGQWRERKARVYAMYGRPSGFSISFRFVFVICVVWGGPVRCAVPVAPRRPARAPEPDATPQGM